MAVDVAFLEVRSTVAIVRRGSGRGEPSGGHPGTLWGKLGARFWFVPALITANAVALFCLTQSIDQLTHTYLGTMPILFSGGATAARSVLAAIAGGIISVTGTVFSITIVTLQLASSSYTPRVLRSFTSDRGVQIVLGTFVGTFLYSLLVLRIVREAQAEGASFNPVISVTVALVLALLCVALLIYFIAHVVNLTQSSTIVGSVHEDTTEAIARLDDFEDTPLEDPDGAWPSRARRAARGRPARVTGQAERLRAVPKGWQDRREDDAGRRRWRADDRRRGAVRVRYLRRRGTPPGEGLARASIIPGRRGRRARRRRPGEGALLGAGLSSLASGSSRT